MDIDKLTKLARERSMNLKDLDEILNIFELTKEEYERLEQREDFKRILEQHNIEWNSATNTLERVKLRSAISLENGMGALSDRMTNPNEPLAACIEAAKMFAKNAGIGDKDAKVNDADRFVITINLGEDYKLKIDKPIKSDPMLIEAKEDA
jgi:hypothetical protein